MSRTEVAVSIVSVSLIASITAPMLLRASEHQKQVLCQNTLRRLGVAFHTFADRDESARLCSGIPDWLYDGCPDTFGWPADARRTLGSTSISPLCPSNPAQVPDTFEDLIGKPDAVSISQMSPISRGFVDVGRCHDFSVSFSRPHDIADSGTWLGGTSERVIATGDIVEAGFATNYAASWYLVRTGFLPEEKEDGSVTTREGLTGRHRAATIGPLRIQTIERCNVPASNLPLLGDAAPGRRSTEQLEAAGLVSAEAPAATSLSGVTSYYNDRRDIIMTMPPGAMIRPVDYENPANWKYRPYCKDIAPTPDHPHGDGGMDGKLWLSDLRGWKAVHPVNGGTLSVLMADGSVKSLVDSNGDGFINPGFEIRPPGTGQFNKSTETSRTGYIDNTTEVFSGTMYTLGEIQHDYKVKGEFE